MFPNELWTNEMVIHNLALIKDLVIFHPDMSWSWDWAKLSDKRVSLDFILNNLDKDWNWTLLSSNDKLTIEFILSHPDKDWD